MSRVCHTKYLLRVCHFSRVFQIGGLFFRWITDSITSPVGAVNELFDEESHLKQYDWSKLDLTEFFIAYVKAGSYVFNKITGGDKNNIEFTHLANQLIIQDLLKDKSSIKNK